ncbi:MAG: DNA-directed RNA polymerase II subunit RPB2 [Satyrvirus sp.]|uniref:DNA-directed RNA polymerase II subunit RPB2 n=1 Tax=Satyrvirus sp. TaxID=2487771 RepID=A0A3G5AEZ0_9VIRU|nr:MAG: DNA-directed RNA polymerase II subunit RPB2 [Satyrvirus sp.]
MSNRLRFGEMERDAVCDHGISQLMSKQPELFTLNDTHVCSVCGSFAYKNGNGIYSCIRCKDQAKIIKLDYPKEIYYCSECGPFYAVQKEENGNYTPCVRCKNQTNISKILLDLVDVYAKAFTSK